MNIMPEVGLELRALHPWLLGPDRWRTVFKACYPGVLAFLVCSGVI